MGGQTNVSLKRRECLLRKASRGGIAMPISCPSCNNVSLTPAFRWDTLLSQLKHPKGLCENGCVIPHHTLLSYLINMWRCPHC